MTIASQTNRTTLTGNGVTTDIPVSFPFHAAADLVVIETIIATGVQTTKTITTHYTVTGTADAYGHYPDGGTVVMVTAPASTVTITVYRDVAATQSVDPTENNPLPVESTIESPLDRLTMIAIRLKERLNRSLRQPEGDTADIDYLPSKVDRASKYLTFDADGDPTAAAAPADTTAVSAFMATVLDDTTAAAARTTLDVPSNAEAILDALIAAKGDLIVGTADNTPAILSVGANGTIPVANSGVPAGLSYAAALTKHIHGLTYANNSGDAANDIDIAAGGAMDATGAYFMGGSALTKQLDAAWAVGTNAGGLDTGSIGNSDYYIWLIARSDTGVVDALFSLSSTSPTMPTNYDYKRLIGWFKRVGGAIVAFDTYETEGGGLELIWDVPTLDVDLAATLGTARRTDAVKVPLNFSTEAHLNVSCQDAGAAAYIWIYCPDQADTNPSQTAAPLSNIHTTTSTTPHAFQIHVRTSATGTIAAEDAAITIDNYRVSTMGFKWARRN